MAITASQVNELRKITGAGMMDCKKALQESDGDMDAAIDYLRKKGQKVSEKRSDRESNEGVVIALTTNDAAVGVAVEVNCETDFVAKNADFVAFAQSIADTALTNLPADKDELLTLSIDGVAIKDKLIEQIGKIGEKIEVSNYEVLRAPQVVAYNHAGNRIGVLVGLNKAVDGGADAGKDAAMQVAAMNPIAVDKASVSQAVIDREIEIAKELIKAEGKPEELAEKIAKGKLDRFFKDNTLLSQPFVKDNSKDVAEMLKTVDKDLTVNAFKRIAIGG